MYVIENIEVGIVKIGIASNLQTRVSSIICSSGCKIEIRGFSVGLLNAREIESMMHDYFSKYRKIGEWFNISSQDAVNKLNELQEKYGKFDPVAKMYNEGKSITFIAKFRNCTRQNIIYHLKKIGVHDKDRIVSEQENEIKSNYGQIDLDLKENKDLISGEFKILEKNISTNGKCFQLKVWMNGRFYTKYFHELDDAKIERHNLTNK